MNVFIFFHAWSPAWVTQETFHVTRLHVASVQTGAWPQPHYCNQCSGLRWRTASLAQRCCTWGQGQGRLSSKFFQYTSVWLLLVLIFSGLISSFTHTYGLHGAKTILKAIYPLKFAYHPLINKLINTNNLEVKSSWKRVLAENNILL